MLGQANALQNKMANRGLSPGQGDRGQCHPSCRGNESVFGQDMDRGNENPFARAMSNGGNPFKRPPGVAMPPPAMEDSTEVSPLGQSVHVGNPFRQFQESMPAASCHDHKPTEVDNQVVSEQKLRASSEDVFGLEQFIPARFKMRHASQQDLISPSLEKLCPGAATLREIGKEELMSWEDRIHRITSAHSPDITDSSDNRPFLPCCVDGELGLYLGDECSARDFESLERLGIDAVINCGAPVVEYPENFEHLELGCEDTDGYPLLARHLDQCLSFLERCENEQRTVLVHCVMGLNRSASVMAAFLMLSRQLPLLSAVQKVWECRGRLPILTNGSFRRQLVQLAHLTGNLG